MRNNTSPSGGSTIVDKLKVYEGGTGVTDAASARTQLGVVAASDLNQPNGIAKLGTDGLLPASLIPDDGAAPIGVQGPASVVVGTVAQYTITNYDIFTNYQLTAISGTVLQIGQNIAYSAPATAGAGGFVINGRTVNVTVDTVRPSTPTLTGTTVANGSSNASAVLQSSAFAMNTSSVATHLNTDWQIATDAAYTNVVSSSMADATNKTSWASTFALALSTTYYARCRYRDSNNGVSDWATFSFTTKANYVLISEQAQLVPTVRNASATFGWAVAATDNGNRVIVGARVDRNVNNVQSGAAYVFVRNGTSWTQEAKLEASTPLTSAGNYGCSVSISSDGVRVAVGSDNDTGGVNAVGAVYVYVRNTSTNVWTQEQRIADPSPTTGVGSGADAMSYFASAIQMDFAGTRIIAGAYANDTSGINQGRIHIFVRSGSTWSVETSINCPADIAADYASTGVQNFFGIDVTIAGDGTRCAVSSAGYVGGTTDRRISIYSRSGSTWTFEQYVTFGNNNGYLTVRMDGTGTRIVIGRYDETVTFSSDGALYIFRRSGSTWTQEQKLTVTATTSSNQLGRAVAINSDGSSIVALRAGDNGAAYGSAMYNYTRVGTTWTFNRKFNGSTVSAQTGNSVAVSGDANTAVLGYPNNPVSSVTVGSAFVYTS
jgi:hypothetical protein